MPPQSNETISETPMPHNHHKTIVRRYFSEVLDGGNLDVLGELVTEDCIIHRPEVEIRGLSAFRQGLGRILQGYSELTTTLHDLFAEGDRVACRLSHRAVNRGEWNSRIGCHDVAGKPVAWTAMAIFRFEGGKIAEEWVVRDELGMLIDLGVAGSARVSS